MILSWCEVATASSGDRVARGSYGGVVRSGRDERSGGCGGASHSAFSHFGPPTGSSYVFSAEPFARSVWNNNVGCESGRVFAQDG